ncbi:hypothetical protein HYD77_03720 [Mycoplasmopsis bovis]|nr:hypothetical protein [Mycoplasmopsis bovis]QQH43667.1 hypothetical protein HYD77_03720 [Mycoplasmopsis bovis]
MVKPKKKKLESLNKQPDKGKTQAITPDKGRHQHNTNWTQVHWLTPKPGTPDNTNNRYTD